MIEDFDLGFICDLGLRFKAFQILIWRLIQYTLPLLGQRNCFFLIGQVTSGLGLGNYMVAVFKWNKFKMNKKVILEGTRIEKARLTRNDFRDNDEDKDQDAERYTLI